MEPDDLGSFAALHWPEAELPDRITAAKTATAAAGAPPADVQGDVQDGMPGDAQAAVSALYRAYAVGLIRLAYLMLGDRAAAEDAVQDAFCGLYRRW
ncbi:MAG TPA: sigma factor, partial [Streptosporangiaceae bacterium]|nr:sigma factor [Streptosporangiaceae bacterium]